ncbi:CoA-transferase [Corynebacterium sp. S7]
MKKLSKAGIVSKAVRDIPSGSYVNLGIGMPVMALDCWAGSDNVIIHSENGILGMRRLEDNESPSRNLISAAKNPVGVVPGAAFFHHSDSFAMMRGGHIDYSILGAYEVSTNGDLANWSLDRPGVAAAVGGAMDLAVGAKNVWVVMEHVSQKGLPRLVENCTLPLTGPACISRIYTDLATIAITEVGFSVLELTEGVTPDYLQSVTAAPLDFSSLSKDESEESKIREFKEQK